MTMRGIDSVDLDQIQPGYTVELKISKQSFVSKMLDKSKEIGCALKLLNYGVFYFSEIYKDPEERDKVINKILES